jgi:hypothetical protein
VLRYRSALRLSKPDAAGHQAIAARLIEQNIAELKAEQAVASGR